VPPEASEIIAERVEAVQLDEEKGLAALANILVHDPDDFDIDLAERAVKKQYNSHTKKWTHTFINVVVTPRAFAQGGMRQAFHMQDLSFSGDDKKYVLKLYKNITEEPQIYYEDVKMQMEAKMWAVRYNDQNPPKHVDFLDAYVLQLNDRSDKPIYAVEKYIGGEYKKYNNNGDWSDDQRNTPQAFSHFTYQESKHTILVCDIQGVGDVWTDPQVHSYDQEGYGKGNMGQEGMDKFLESHECNPICRYLKLTPTGRVKRDFPGETLIRSQPPRTSPPPTEEDSAALTAVMTGGSREGPRWLLRNANASRGGGLEVPPPEEDRISRSRQAPGEKIDSMETVSLRSAALAARCEGSATALGATANAARMDWLHTRVFCGGVVAVLIFVFSLMLLMNSEGGSALMPAGSQGMGLEKENAWIGGNREEVGRISHTHNHTQTLCAHIRIQSTGTLTHTQSHTHTHTHTHTWTHVR